MTATGLDAPWETTTPLMHRRCNDGVIQVQLSEFVGHSRGRINSGISLLAKTAFSMKSQLRHHYLVSCKYWWEICSIFQSHGLWEWFMPKNMKSCPNFSKVMAKKLLVPFSPIESKIVLCKTCREGCCGQLFLPDLTLNILSAATSRNTRTLSSCGPSGHGMVHISLTHALSWRSGVTPQGMLRDTSLPVHLVTSLTPHLSIPFSHPFFPPFPFSCSPSEVQNPKKRFWDGKLMTNAFP